MGPLPKSHTVLPRDVQERLKLAVRKDGADLFTRACRLQEVLAFLKVKYWQFFK